MKSLQVLVISVLTLICSLFFSQNVAAQNEGRWYQVEFLIFKRLAASEQTNETWRQDLSLKYPKKSRYLPNTLPKSAHSLGGHNYTLRKSGQYRVLFHKAWQQQMWGEKKSPALIVRGGERYGAYRELEGYIKIYIGRYLHVSTDLWLNDFIADQQNNDANQQIRLPLLPSRASSQDTIDETEFFIENPQPSQTIVFREKRRMRSKETHYIDHPLMGVMVRMLPIDPPTPSLASTP